jgi:hypothetical protein
MGLVWTSGSAGEFAGAFDGLADKLTDGLEDAMRDIVTQAVADAKRFTASRPGAQTGKSGRVETGAMLNAIAGDSWREGVANVVGEFGFTDESELYFALQTITGFRHWGAGEFIAPTFALIDAARIAFASMLSVSGFQGRSLG